MSKQVLWYVFATQDSSCLVPYCPIFQPPGEMETGSNIAKRAQKTQGYINGV